MRVSDIHLSVRGRLQRLCLEIGDGARRLRLCSCPLTVSEHVSRRLERFGICGITREAANEAIATAWGSQRLSLGLVPRIDPTHGLPFAVHAQFWFRVEVGSAAAVAVTLACDPTRVRTLLSTDQARTDQRAFLAAIDYIAQGHDDEAISAQRLARVMRSNILF